MRTLLIVLLAAGLSGCADDIQFAEPPKKPALRNSRGNMPMPKTDETADPFADPEADRAANRNQEGADASKNKPFYKGTVKLSEGYELPSVYTVYVVAYPPGTRMPALVQPYRQPSFPFPFILTLEAARFGEPQRDIALQLGVILSESGAVTPGSGVYSKTLQKDALKPGAMDVVLTVSK